MSRTELTEVKEAVAYFCEHKHRCKWQAMNMHQGLAWGSVPDRTNTWMQWHERECGGRLIQLFLGEWTPAPARPTTNLMTTQTQENL